VNPNPKIGITCYPSQGGSGIVASELGLSLAAAGYEVHFITSALPVRLREYADNVFFHQVDVEHYPVFTHAPYTLSLATKMSDVARHHDLDILHVHYAIPHAASAFLAREMVGRDRLKVVTTLHGTDITLVGQKPGYFAITRFMIEQSDATTAVSAFLRDETKRIFGVENPIEVIPNFVDCRRFRPRADPALRARFAEPGQKLMLHASNFREVKNAPMVVDVFARVAERTEARLLLLGEGPELPRVEQRAAELGVLDRILFLGQVEDLERMLPLADLVLLPSRHESFGLVALEAMACGTPVIATDRGGTGEFIDPGVNSFLCDPFDAEAMTACALRILGDPEAHAAMAEAARRDVNARFATAEIRDRYASLYRRVLETGPAR